MDQVNSEAFRAREASSGTEIAPDFPVSSTSDVERICAAAEGAFDAYRALPSERRAAFLEAIGEEILAIGDDVLDRVRAGEVAPDCAAAVLGG